MSNPNPRVRFRSYRSFAFLLLVGCTVNGKALGPQFSSSSSSTPSSSPTSSSSSSSSSVADSRRSPDDDPGRRQFERHQAEREAERQREREANAAHAEHKAFCGTLDAAKDASDRENEDRRAWKEVAGCHSFEPFTFWHIEEQAKASQVWHLAAVIRCFEDAGGELEPVKPAQLAASTYLTRYAFCAYDGQQLDRKKLEAELTAKKDLPAPVKARIVERFATAKAFVEEHAAAYTARAKESPAVANVLAAGKAAFDGWTTTFKANQAVFDRIIDVERRGDGSRKALAGCAAKLRPAFFELIAKHKPKTDEDYRAMIRGSYASRLVDALAFCEEIDGDGVTGGLLREGVAVARGPRRAAAAAALAKIVEEQADNPKFSSSPHLFVPGNARPDGSHFELKTHIPGVVVRGGLVAKVQPEGDRITVTFKQTSWMETTYDCKDTNRVGRVNADGSIYWQQDCKPKGKEKVTWTERAVTMPAVYANAIKAGQFVLALRKRNEHEHYNDGEPLWGALPMFVYADTSKQKLLSVLGQSL